MAQEFYIDGTPSRTIADDDADDRISMLVAERKADRQRIAALEAALRPFARAWENAHKTAPKATLGQLGHLCGYEVSGVHFQAALRVLEDHGN